MEAPLLRRRGAYRPVAATLRPPARRTSDFEDLPRRTHGLSLFARSLYGERVSAPSTTHWSALRSLAFLAATFAVVFGALLPSAVAASAATGAPIVLCSGEQVRIVYDADGAAHRETPSAADSLRCADCVLSALAALPPPPPPHSFSPPQVAATKPAPIGTSPASCTARAAPRPPSTAPPVA
jgi:hypothetical protein